MKKEVGSGVGSGPESGSRSGSISQKYESRGSGSRSAQKCHGSLTLLASSDDFMTLFTYKKCVKTMRQKTENGIFEKFVLFSRLNYQGHNQRLFNDT